MRRASASASVAHPHSTDRGATVRGATVGRAFVGRRSLTAAALLGASFVALAASAGLAPVHAQRSDAGVATSMGRAPLSFADIAERVKPAVVSISVSSGGRTTAQAPGQKGPPATPPQGRGNQQRPPIPGLPEEWNEFFRNLPRDFGQGGGGAPRPVQAQGSGFVISEDGYVVTNNHVIDKANKIEVVFDTEDSSEKLEAELIGADPRTDIALLKIKGSTKKFPFVRFAAKNPRVGDWVVAVGNPFGLGGTVTAGIVSALARSGIAEGPYDFLQIDAAVNRGNSGGPTFNLDGDVVGVNTAIYSPSGGNVGIAFAVPAPTVMKVVDQLRATGSVARGWLGVKIQNVDKEMASTYGLTEASGALVQEVTAKGPAEASGLRVEDVILSVNDAKIKDTKDLALKIAEYAPNTVVDVRVRRGTRDEIVKVKLGRFPGATDVAAAPEKAEPAPRQFTSLGLAFANQAASTGRRGNTPPARDSGLTISAVEEGTDAATKGINTGDVVTHVNGEAVASADDVEAVVKRANRGPVRLTVKSDNRTAIVAIRPKG